MKNRKVWLGMIALAVVVCLMAGLWWSSRPETVEGTKNVTIMVVHKDASEKIYAFRTEAENLGQLLLEEGLAEGEAGQYGLMISTVDGETADWSADRGYWSIYIGTEYATTGADGIMLTDGGEYRLEYTVG